MADETRNERDGHEDHDRVDAQAHEDERAAAKEELLNTLTDEQRELLLGGDKIEALSEEEIKARLVASDSGDTLEHEDVVRGLASELSAQSRVIDNLSEQREPEGINIAKVLDSSKIDLAHLWRPIEGETRKIIGKNADPEQRQSIQNEINLPNGTAIKMSMKAVIIRIGRVAVTASSIFLGIAFFASVRAGALFLEAAGEASGQEDQARLIWLIVMALLVSVVGITNSMLMAVTERFREIGTMKCLGALDSFIVKLFLIESAFLGLLAGVTGALVGIGLMYIVNAIKYDFAFSAVWLGMLAIAGQSILIGGVLSMIAAILPARQAAKMPAAAALRSTV